MNQVLIETNEIMYKDLVSFSIYEEHLKKNFKIMAKNFKNIQRRFQFNQNKLQSLQQQTSKIIDQFKKQCQQKIEHLTISTSNEIKNNQNRLQSISRQLQNMNNTMQDFNNFRNITENNLERQKQKLDNFNMKVFQIKNELNVTKTQLSKKTDLIDFQKLHNTTSNAFIRSKNNHQMIQKLKSQIQILNKWVIPNQQQSQLQKLLGIDGVKQMKQGMNQIINNIIEKKNKGIIYIGSKKDIDKHEWNQTNISNKTYLSRNTQIEQINNKFNQINKKLQISALDMKKYSSKIYQLQKKRINPYSDKQNQLLEINRNIEILFQKEKQLQNVVNIIDKRVKSMDIQKVINHLFQQQKNFNDKIGKCQIQIKFITMSLTKKIQGKLQIMQFKKSEQKKQIRFLQNQLLISQKSDKNQVKKAILFIQNQIKDLSYVTCEQQQNQKDALVTKKLIKCLSCDKQIDKLNSQISQEKVFYRMPIPVQTDKLTLTKKTKHKEFNNLKKIQLQ